MAKRKTIKVADLVEKANHMLLHTPDSFRDNRRGIQSMLESVLHDTGNYKGFNYLTPDMMQGSENGNSFGVDPAGKDYKARFDNTDNSRVYYY